MQSILRATLVKIEIFDKIYITATWTYVESVICSQTIF